jgi:hypothetical protein
MLFTKKIVVVNKKYEEPKKTNFLFFKQTNRGSCVMSIIAKTIKYTIVAAATVTGFAVGATLSLVAGTYIVTRNARRILDETGHFENDYIVADKKVDGQSWSFSIHNKQ